LNSCYVLISKPVQGVPPVKSGLRRGKRRGIGLFIFPESPFDSPFGDLTDDNGILKTKGGLA